MPKRSVEEPVMAEKTAGGQEQVYKTEKLRENCMQLFGVTSSTFDGAFYKNEKTEMSVSEARAVINKWLGRKEG